MKQTMTVREAARIMGVSEQTVRLGLQQGVFGFGTAVKSSSKYTYIINRSRFNEEWGEESEQKPNQDINC